MAPAIEDKKGSELIRKVLQTGTKQERSESTTEKYHGKVPEKEKSGRTFGSIKDNKGKGK